MIDRESRLAVLVHEVRSPVAALAAIAAAAGDTSGAGRVELVRLCLGACASIERLVRDVTVASVRSTAVDVGAIVRDAALARSLAGNSVVVDIVGSLPAVHGDPVRLRQAVDNLLENAVVHGGRSGAVTVVVRGTATTVTVSVADSGPGIPASELASIFDPGVRLDPRRGSAGLGLAIAKAVVEAQGGSLTVDSPAGGGSTFTIALPHALPHVADGQPDT